MLPVETLLSLTCTISHQDPGPVDEYGDHPLAEVITTDERCWLAQSTRLEDNGIEAERWLLYLPPTVVIDANDAVVVGPDTFYVRGNPWLVTDPVTTAPSHIEATLERRI